MAEQCWREACFLLFLPCVGLALMCPFFLVSAEVVDGVPSTTGLNQVSQSPKGRLSAPLNPNAHALTSREISFSWISPPGKPQGYKVRGEWIPGEGVGPTRQVFHTHSCLR